MSLVSDLINEAFLDLNAIAPGEGITTAEQTDAFLRLNQRLAILSTQQLAAYNVVHQGFQLVPNTTDYTLGTAGSFVSAATPVRVTGASGVSGAFKGSIEVLSFDALAARASNPRGVTAALPELLAADNAWPAINIRVHPIPSGAPGMLWLDFWTALVQFAAVGSNVSLPPGYELMLVKLLAVDLYPQYARPGSTIEIIAAQAQAARGEVAALYASILGKDVAPPATQQ